MTQQEDFACWQEALKKCEKCSLVQTRTQVVSMPFVAAPKIVLLGEAPGGNEDLQGVPFCGKAGRILADFLQLAQLERSEVYISNVVKCRPTKPSQRGIYGNYANRKPTPAEISICSPWLEAELQILQPKLLVTLGAVPLSYVLGKNFAIGKFHGKEFYSSRFGLTVFPLYHPAALIYDVSKKAAYEKDVMGLGELCKTLI